MDDHNYMEMREHLLMRQHAALRAVRHGLAFPDACLPLFAMGTAGLGRTAYFSIETPVGEQMDWVENWAFKGFNVSMSWDAYDSNNIAARLAFIIKTGRPQLLSIPPAIITESEPGGWQATFILENAMGNEESLSCGVRLGIFGTLSSIWGVPNWKCRRANHRYMPFITRCLWRSDNTTSANALRML